MLTILYKLWRYGAFTWNEMRPSEIVQRSSLDGSLHCSESEVAQSCPTLCDPVDCSLPGSSVHGIFQAIVLEWIAISFSRGSSQPGLELGSPAWQTLYSLSHQGSPLQQCTFNLDWIAKNSEMYRYSVISQNYSKGWGSILGVSDSKTHLS